MTQYVGSHLQAGDDRGVAAGPTQFGVLSHDRGAFGQIGGVPQTCRDVVHRSRFRVWCQSSIESMAWQTPLSASLIQNRWRSR